MVNPAIIDYIRDAENKGYTDEQLKKFLLQNGYTVAHINEAFKEYHDPTLPPRIETTTRPRIVERKKRTLTFTKRNPFLVGILCVLTLGVYALYWLISTTHELGEEEPKPFALSVPATITIILIGAYFFTRSFKELLLTEVSSVFFNFGGILVFLGMAAAAVVTFAHYCWQYSIAVQKRTQFPRTILFLSLLIFPLGAGIAQAQFNKF